MIYHTLSQEDQELTEKVARGRTEKNLKNKRKNLKYDKTRNDYEMNFSGVSAEIAFARMFGVDPDLTFDRPQYPVYDVELKSGLKVDVKETRYRNGHLIVMPHKKSNPAQAYALVISDYPRFRFVGWVDAWTVFKNKDGSYREIDPKFKAYAIAQEDLFDPDRIEKAKVKNET